MPMALDMQSADFEQRFQALLAAKRESSADVDVVVADIIGDVRDRGDVALAELSLRFDRVDVGRIGLKISPAEVEAAIAACDDTALEALKLAHARVMDFHLRQKPADLFFTDPLGVQLGWRWRPIDAVGLYVPGGAASYPSSVVMNAVPAKVAGCRRLAMVMPTPDGHINPLALAAARIAGVDEIYRVGGAQAIAALAYGTDTIAPVDKIVGPGNAYVAAAKRRVFGVVGIDMIAGPSEVVVLADSSADPALCRRRSLGAGRARRGGAVDPHHQRPAPRARGGSRSRSPARRACRAPRSRAQVGATTARSSSARRLRPPFPWSTDWRRSISRSWRMIPRRSAIRIANAGAIFLGAYTPEAIGDYVGGSNHVLPTARSARFSSGLNVLDFMKRTSLLKCDLRSLEALGPAAVTLGKAEGLEAHARSVSLRLRANRP